MKKLLVLILSLFYLGSSTGATIHVHYCMDKLVTWGFSEHEDNECSNCGMTKESSKGCCKDEHKQIKFQSDHKLIDASVSFMQQISEASLPSLPNYYSFVSLPDDTHSFPLSNAPPVGRRTAIYIYNCTFLI